MYLQVNAKDTSRLTGSRNHRN